MTQIHELTAIELAAAIRVGEVSPVAVTDHYLRRTAELNEQVGAFYTVTAELAAEQALAAEKAVARAVDPAGQPPRWPRVWLRPPRAAMAAGPSASPRQSTGCSASNRPAAGSPRVRSIPTWKASVP